jgi:hypothetical protein
MAKTTYGLLEFDGIWDWDPQQVPQQVKKLFQQVLAVVDDKIHWYHTWRRNRGRLANIIRVLAVALLAVSTLIPYGATLDTKNPTVYLSLGYLLAGLGGGLLLLDRFYGFSNSWLRFVLTGMDLENIRNAFVENWQILYINSLPLTKTGVSNLVNALLVFQETFHGVVKAETETWAREFQQNMKDLISALKVQSDQLKSNLEEIRKASLTKTPAAADDGVKPASIAVIREAMNRKVDEWKELFNVVAVSSGKKMVDGKRTETPCLVFTPTAKLQAGQKLFTPIPATIRYQSVDGHPYDIPTDVRPSGGVIRAANKPALLCDTTIPKRPGCSISRDASDNAGTLGLKVFRNGRAFLVSCYHVLCDPELVNGQLNFSVAQSVGSTGIVSPALTDGDSRQNVAKVVEGELSIGDGLDCALAQLTDPLLVTGDFCSIDATAGLPIDVSESDEGILPLICVGRTSGVLKGTIESAFSHCDIVYTIKGKDQVLQLNGLVSTNLNIQAGDSGAVVLNSKTHEVIGMVVARTDSFSYLIPINRILSKFSVTLK